MEKDAFIYFQDNKYLHMYWRKDESIIKREIIGIDELFNSKVIAVTEATSITLEKKKLKEFFEIKVNSYDKDNNIIQNTVMENKEELEHISIKCLESYEGLTLSFDTHYNIYDRYILYEVKKDEKKIIITSEDFQFNSKKIKEGKKYYVEAFMLENNNYILKAKSDIYTCKIDKIEPFKGKPKISIVMPAYNTDFFLPRTVDSVLFSSLKEIELIIIDDGSTDKGPEMIDWYSQKYKGIIKGYHQENQGLSFARNNGVKHATGEYTAFLDSDDLVQQYMYEELYIAAKETKCPIAIGKTYVRDKINSHYLLLDVPNPDNKRYITYTYEETITKKIKCAPDNIFFVSVWHKIIDTDLVKKHPHPHSNLYEDSAYTPMIYSYADKLAFAFNAYYIWDKRRRKTTGTYSRTGYQDNWRKLHKAFIKSLLFASKKGNKKHLDLILFDAVNDIYSQVSAKNVDENSGLYKLYKKELIKLNEKYPLLENKGIAEKEDLASFLKKIL